MIRGVFLLVGLFLSCQGDVLAASDLNASWEYATSGASGAATQKRFLQRYNLNTGFALEPTRAIGLGAHLAYSRNDTSNSGLSEVITPSGNFSLSNDIFAFDLSGTRSEDRRSTAATRTTYNWSGTFGSNWSYEFWPSLQLHYNRSGVGSEDNRTDIKSSTYGLDLNWELPVLLFNYGFSKGQTKDLVNLTRSDSTTHFARVETEGSFWDKRLVTKLSQAVNYSKQVMTIGTGGRYDQDLGLPSYSVTSSDPGFVDHLADPPLKPFAAITISSLQTDQEAGHLAVLGLFDEEGEQQIDQFWVMVDADTDLIAKDLIDKGDLQWSLFVSTDNLNWEPVPGQSQLDVSYNSADRRFEILVPALSPPSSLYDYLKVVVVNSGNNNVTLTAFRAIQFVS
ncbi:MAG: hypothetical protein P8X63_09580, partial [Desulfuromonadaceae bacterium]